MKLLRAVGVDRPVAYTILARATGILGSAGTVLLIARFLSAVEQGYYYTLLSLVSLQIVFELGFSFVVQQLAAHECAYLELGADGSVRGDSAAHARLASALQLTMRWYTVAALAMGVLVAPLGAWFFTQHAVQGISQVVWQGPWYAAVAATMCNLWCVPLYAFLEGCGEVRATAAMRLRQSVVTAALAWLALLLHHGLYAPALMIGGQAVTGLVFLGAHRRLLLGLVQHAGGRISWLTEVWPFQWRIGVSSMCSYFMVQAFIPIVFAMRGPVESGQMGMSLSIAGYMTVLALSWTATKATPFGQMVARGEFRLLDKLFLRMLGRSVVAFAVLAIFAVTGIAVLPFILPGLAVRMLPVPLFALLVLGAGANHIVQSIAIVLRCFKREPLIVQAPLVAILTLVLAMFTVPRWGNVGAAIGYFLATGVVGLPIACAIFMRARRYYLATDRLDSIQHELPLSQHCSAESLPGG
jgi:hypothetical protein